MLSPQDKTLAQELSLDKLSEEQQELQIASFYNTLQLRVGMALEDKLSDEQLAEFEKVNDKGDDEATEAWLRTAVTDYEEVFAKEYESLKQDIQKSAAGFQSIIDDLDK